MNTATNRKSRKSAPISQAVTKTVKSKKKPAAKQKVKPVVVSATAKAKKEPPPSVAQGVYREERNGIKRPRPGGLCAAVWEYLDKNGNCTPKKIRETATDKGWNQNNAQIELYQWRKFMGLSRPV